MLKEFEHADAPRFWMSFAILALSLTSCAVTPPSKINENYREVLYQRHNNYKIKDGDTLVIRLYNRPGDLNQTDVVVLPDGRCDLFYMDNVQIGGLTIPEVEKILKERIAQELPVMEVSIQVRPRAERVHLVGQFERPMSMDLTTKMTLHEAVSAAGGLRVTGDTDYALLRRPFMNPAKPDTYRIDLNDELEEIFLLPGDQVVLDRTFVAGFINYLREYVFGFIPTSPIPYAAAAGFAM
jgi:protein involved in polysaccharide export with SLBB domain